MMAIGIGWARVVGRKSCSCSPGPAGEPRGGGHDVRRGVRDRERKGNTKRRSGGLASRLCTEPPRGIGRPAVGPISSTSRIWAQFWQKMDCKLIKLKSSILLCTKVHFIFRGPFKFGSRAIVRLARAQGRLCIQSDMCCISRAEKRLQIFFFEKQKRLHMLESEWRRLSVLQSSRTQLAQDSVRFTVRTGLR